MSNSSTDFQAQLQAAREAYATQLPARIDDIQRCWHRLATGPWSPDAAQALQRLTHTLVGSSGTFGFAAVSRRARDMDRLLTDCLAKGDAPSESQRAWMGALVLQLDAAARRDSRPDASVPTEEPAQRLQQAVSLSKAAGRSGGRPTGAGFLATADDAAYEMRPASDQPGERLVRSGSAGTALIAEDEPASREILAFLLQKEGYHTVAAEDGAQAVAAFQSHDIDIVFMDVVMPNMDGYEATRRIKALAGDRFVPLIFLTSLTKEQELASCVAAGGDDFLTKPANPTLIKAKIAAAERVRDLYRTVYDQRMQTLRDEEIAEQIFSAAVAGGNVMPRPLRALMRSAATFSGDVLLTGRSPSGAMYVLLGDFTGHGLTAAIGALPASLVFRAMTAKGYAPADILREINRQLHRVLPTGMFLAACFLSVSANARVVSIWNGGLPDVLVVSKRSGRISHRFSSTHLALGILEDIADPQLQLLAADVGDQVIICSDGVSEARSRDGEVFGTERLERCLRGDDVGQAFDRLQLHLDAFTAGEPQDDDVSVVAVSCEPELLAVESGGAGELAPASAGANAILSPQWQWTLELGPESLRRTDVVSSAIEHLTQFHDLQEHRQFLYTILSELFNNALEHGVLGMDAAGKGSDEGFCRYMKLREERLVVLKEGYVRLELKVVAQGCGGRLDIVVTDSGPGFDFSRRQAKLGDNISVAGRGIALVRALCDSLTYQGRGNRAHAVYSWE